MASDLWFLLSDPYTWITLLDYTLGAIFVSQWGVAIAVFFGANLVVYYYDLGYEKHPEALWEKILNLIYNLYLWFPVYLYKRVSPYPFLIRKLLYAVFTVVGAAVYGIIWMALHYLLKLLLLEHL
ncbi:hypothetical protein [Parageobacillus thermoglucosidasius]|uniref:hypothetical protein n=1 Tax=Parageobacillus thermoglucosidasius TaxID=1426 RepID=UPI002E232D84|nr:hypothetical protein [Parageobacillus thermoglucosidasius]MED4912779.1 hypothetical protein [Parageobacillus thermoglucosidasius]MED4945169.1 hypothetical protein [Parageobacillus thermoglucosidasius]MED4982278.1 hypothetical protein [Parageobacillus thermoglucosidasius]